MGLIVAMFFSVVWQGYRTVYLLNETADVAMTNMINVVVAGFLLLTVLGLVNSGWDEVEEEWQQAVDEAKSS